MRTPGCHCVPPGGHCALLALTLCMSLFCSCAFLWLTCWDTPQETETRSYQAFRHHSWLSPSPPWTVAAPESAPGPVPHPQLLHLPRRSQQSLHSVTQSPYRLLVPCKEWPLLAALPHEPARDLSTSLSSGHWDVSSWTTLTLQWPARPTWTHTGFSFKAS